MNRPGVTSYPKPSEGSVDNPQDGGVRSSTMRAVDQTGYGSAHVLHAGNVEGPQTSTQKRKTMTAAVQIAYGEDAHRVIEIASLPIPTPEPDQVLVEVAASSTNALDWHFMTGHPYFLRLTSGLRSPKRVVPGADVAGTVVEVGADVSEFEIGDRVFGEIGGGGFAEYVAVKATHLAHAPGSIPLDGAATLGVAALTALQGLRDWAKMKEGDRVLINGASGGVGSFAIQIAKALGASHVTAVCSTANVETAKSLGADRVIDYKKEDLTSLDDKFDVFFDNAGSKSLRASRRMLADNGVFVMITGKKGKWFRPADRMIGGAVMSRFWSQRFAAGTAQANSADSATLATMVDAGQVRPVIDRRFTLAEAVDALAYQAEGHARGKTVVTVS
ncbi:MAG TPA: NAD(P)-dependent alcohol dehydrogenase [Acidimicrobiia bacterium]|nr:NAD(P)-dependent alcohol dehydrogenase [Acidimicrobiia bacterium]